MKLELPKIRLLRDWIEGALPAHEYAECAVRALSDVSLLG